MKKPYVIAEMGCNHQGSIETAKQMIRIASDFCHVDCVKFQKRDVEAFRDNDRPYSGPQSFGATYYEHRKALEFSIEQHRELRDLAASLGVEYACSIFDEKSLREIISIVPSYIKFGSAMNQRTDLISIAITETKLPIHISLGMLTRDEKSDLIHWLHAALVDDLSRLVLYHTTTAYPIAARDACLLEIEQMVETGFSPVGYSGHHQGIALDLVAFALGAEFIERHFTIDRAWKGTDHAASLEPDGMRRLIKYLADASDALDFKPLSGLCACEIESRKKFKGDHYATIRG